MQTNLLPDDFGRRVKDAETWVNVNMSPAYLMNKLRSPDLAPPQRRPFRNVRSEISDHTANTYEMQTIVEGVVALRTKLLMQKQKQNTEQMVAPMTGRLLFYIPDETTSDGYSAELTNGYFDDDDCPAWDTWIAYVGAETRWSRRTGYGWYGSSALIAWVPPSLITLADDAVAGNITDCISWVDEIVSDTAEQIKNSILS
jgi:hypothetical protein